MNSTPFIAARMLVKRYAGSAAPAVIEHLDLDIRCGEVLVVLGRSGSGKSTLLNLLGHMDGADSGAILISGEDSTNWDDQRRTLFRRRNLGFVFQSYNLLPSLTVRENVELPLELNGKLNSSGQRQIDRLLGRLGIAHLSARYPDQISGGEQQRTAIARALVHQPALIIADEPTGNLDLETAGQVLDLFERSVREQGAALLMATHSPDMIGRADRVLELRNGQLQEHRR